jgi:hypothetical protein
MAVINLAGIRLNVQETYTALHAKLGFPTI